MEVRLLGSKTKKRVMPLESAPPLTIALAQPNVENKWIKCDRWVAASAQRHNITWYYVGSENMGISCSNRSAALQKSGGTLIEGFFSHHRSRACTDPWKHRDKINLMIHYKLMVWNLRLFLSPNRAFPKICDLSNADKSSNCVLLCDTNNQWTWWCGPGLQATIFFC